MFLDVSDGASLLFVNASFFVLLHFMSHDVMLIQGHICVMLLLRLQ